MKNNIIKTIKISLTLVFLASISVLTACSAKYSYDFEVLTNVKFDGYDEFGKISCSHSMELIEKLILEDLNRFADATKFSQSINYSFDKSENLRNGDIIKISVNYDEKSVKDLSLNIINKDFSVEVEGLKELEEVKIEDFVDVKYDGIIPLENIKIFNKLGYTIPKFQDLFSIVRDGREIIISLSYPEKIAEYGYRLETNNIKIIMEDVNEYIYTDSAPSKDILSWFEDEVIKAVEKETNNFIVTSTGLINAITSITTGANKIAETFYGDSLIGDIFVLSIDELKLNTTYYNSLKDINKSKEFGFNPTICSMFYVFDLTMTVKCSGLGDEAKLSGILVYWLNNPMIDAKGGYTNDIFSRIGSYKTYQEFIDNHITPNMELFNLTKIK